MTRLVHGMDPGHIDYFYYKRSVKTGWSVAAKI